MHFRSLLYPLGLVLGLAVLGTGLSVYQSQQNTLQESWLQRVHDQAANSYRLSANIIEEETEEMMSLAVAFAGQQPVQEMLGGMLRQADATFRPDQTVSNSEILQRVIVQVKETLGEETALSLIDQQGLTFFCSRADLPSLSLGSWGVSEVLGGRSLLVTTSDGNQSLVRAMVPVKLQQKVLGALIISIKLADLLEQVKAIVETDLFLLNFSGIQAGTHEVEKVPGFAFDQSLINQVLEEKEIQIRQSDGGSHFYFYRMLRVVDEVFCLVIEEDLRPMQQMMASQRQDALLTTLLILATTLLLSSLAGWRILHPLRMLRHRGEKLGKQITGSSAVPSGNGDEITSLVQTFDTMFTELNARDARIQQEQERLEERVHTRTVLLNQQNEQLCQEIEVRRAVEENLREKEQHLDYLAHYDPLTDLPNRILLNDRLSHGFEKALRYGHQAALFFLDLDRFKVVNDTVGHAAGDQLLKEVALRLKALVRQSDTLARLGGDEFVVFLERITEEDQILRLVQKIMESMAQPIYLAGKPFYLTVSVGVSIYPNDGPDAETMMKCADVAMYRAKAQGGDSYQIYTPSMNARAHELLELERELHACLEQQQLILHYQPQIDLNTGKLSGMEALLRWQNPERGLVPPNEFIPLAEQTGLIVAMGEWVLKAACQQYLEWQEQGLPEVRIAVNISPRQFRQGNLVDTVSDVLQETGMKPQNLELEITESMVMDDVEGAIAIMQKLADMGIALAIDDFGSGYSSLAYLKKFPISKLKIDRAFVRDIPHDDNDAAIAVAAIALAKSMDLETIAEGIETKAQLDFLRSQGCTQGQGYFLGRPVESEVLTATWGRGCQQ